MVRGPGKRPNKEGRRLLHTSWPSKHTSLPDAKWNLKFHNHRGPLEVTSMAATAKDGKEGKLKEPAPLTPCSHHTRFIPHEIQNVLLC